MGVHQPRPGPGTLRRAVGRYVRPFRKWMNRKGRQSRENYRYGPQRHSFVDKIRVRLGLRKGQRVLRITLANLEAAHVEICRQIPGEERRSLALATAIIRRMLGEKWFDRYIEPGGKGSVLTIDESNPVSAEKSLIRLIDFAELLYNLQNVAGFDHCLDRLRSGNLEGTIAELDLGRLLYVEGVEFRFVVPTGKKRADYDIDIVFDGGVDACVDAKCKIENSNYSENGIKNVLDHALGQLPKDRPGIVFIKVPIRWLDDLKFHGLAMRCANRFLGGTDRIVSVVYYAFRLDLQDGQIGLTHLTAEFINRKTRFANITNWKLFHRTSPNGSDLPAHWQRIFFFPTGNRKSE